MKNFWSGVGNILKSPTFWHIASVATQIVVAVALKSPQAKQQGVLIDEIAQGVDSSLGGAGAVPPTTSK